MRKGAKVAGRYMVVYRIQAQELRAGFIVSKKVGNAVTRNRVKRRLREIVRLSQLHGDYVFRALPRSASAGYSALHDEVNSLTSKLVSR